MRNAALSVCLLLTFAAAVAAQTPRELEAEPVVKLQAGETEVAGQCLTEQELDLIARLDALRRPTLGVEGDGEGDDPAPFDPHYFVGSWEVEGVLPDSPLAESSEFVGDRDGTARGGMRLREHHRGGHPRRRRDRRVHPGVRPAHEVPGAARGGQPRVRAPQGRPRRRRSRRDTSPTTGRRRRSRVGGAGSGSPAARSCCRRFTTTSACACPSTAGRSSTSARCAGGAWTTSRNPAPPFARIDALTRRQFFACALGAHRRCG